MQETKIDYRSIFKWNTIGNITNLGSKFIISVILQLLLQPADFGIIASILVFAGIAQVMVDNGFQSAIIQAKNISNNGLSTVFYINIGIGSFCTILLFFIAPLLGDFYNESRLVPVTRLIAFTYLLQSFALIQRALFTREHAFKKLAIADIVSNLIAGIIAIIMALNSYGVWSIAAMYVLQILLCNFFLWFQSAWRPLFVFNLREITGLWQYGSKVFLSGLFIYANSRVDLLMTGRFFSAAQQGFYSRGKDYGMLPSSILIGIVSKSYFPIFSRLQDKPIELEKNYYNSLSAISFIGGLIFPLLFLISKDAVLIILKEKWADMIPALSLFIVFSSVHIFNSINSNFLAATGKAKTNLLIIVTMGCIRMLAILVYFVVADNPKTIVIVIMLILFSFIENHLSFFFVRKYNGYGIFKQYGVSYKETFAGWLIAAIIYFLFEWSGWLDGSYLAHLLIATLAFLAAYATACYFIKNAFFVHWLKVLRGSPPGTLR
jgi:O-antigen/teichoic acid export membrane protein